MRADLVILLAAFAAGTLLAELAGARNLGVAFAFGQLAFGLALVAVLVRRPQIRPPAPAPRPAPRTEPRTPAGTGSPRTPRPKGPPPPPPRGGKGKVRGKRPPGR